MHVSNPDEKRYVFWDRQQQYAGQTKIRKPKASPEGCKEKPAGKEATSM